MTNYTDNLEKSQQEAIPEFYTFTHGPTVDRYTSWASDLEFMGETYRAAPIKRSAFSLDADFGTVSMSVSAPLIGTLVHSTSRKVPFPAITLKFSSIGYRDTSGARLILKLGWASPVSAAQDINKTGP